MNPKKHPFSYRLGTFCAYLLIVITTIIGVTGSIAIMSILIDFILR